MNLAEIQVAFQRCLLQQDSGIERSIVGDERLPSAGRLAIYTHAYTARLVGALAASYPAVRSAAEDSQFEDLARRFVASHPSRFASIRYYGREFGDFLEDTVPGSEGIALADLARWEWTLAQAFDGPNATVIDETALADVRPQDWGHVCIRLLPSLQRVSLRTNALAWWRAATQGAPRPTRFELQPISEWVIWRPGLTTSFRSIALDEAWCLDAALHGRAFASLCEGLARSIGEDAAPARAASLLKTWLLEGWVTRFDLT